MKRAAIAATAAALTVPVVLAGPAHADNDLSIKVDPRDWTWSGTISIGPRTICDDDIGTNCRVYEPLASQSFAVNPGSGLQEILNTSMSWTDDDLNVFVNDSEFTIGETTYSGAPMWISIDDRIVGTMAPTPLYEGDKEVASGAIGLSWAFGEPGGSYELKFYPSTWALSQKNLKNAADFTASQTDVTDTAGSRSKNTGYVTDQPGRVTAMAKRFIAAPGDVINIHGYGPDRDTALARAEHVCDHLISEITRLGGDPDTYPVMVTYAGDPSQKKGVHVTIHQHSTSSITVPESSPQRTGDNA